MNRPMPASDLPRSRIPVRVGALEATLEHFNKEMSVKVALSLQKYDQLHVAPLRRRVQWLETPLIVRAYVVVHDWLLARLRKPEALVEPPAPAAAPEPAAPPVPGPSPLLVP